MFILHSFIWFSINTMNFLSKFYLCNRVTKLYLRKLVTEYFINNKLNLLYLKLYVV